MKLTPEALQKLDDQVREIGKHLGMEFDQEYADRQEQIWNYHSEIKSGNKRISFQTGGYKMEDRFSIRGEFLKDKKGQIHHDYNAEWPKITVAIDRGPDKIAKAIQARLMPEYERQLLFAVEQIKKSDAYHDGRLQVLRAVAEYFGQDVSQDDDKAIYPEMGRGIYKIEAVSEGVKFDVSCAVSEALKIFDILKKEENKNGTDNSETIR